MNLLLSTDVYRDDYGFAQKTTYIEVNGEARNVFKDPITDRKKASHKGLLCVTKDFETIQEASWEQEMQGLLKVVFENGLIKGDQNESTN